MSLCVIDASALLRLMTAQPEAEALEQQLTAASLVIAPALLLTEVANVLWKLQRAKALPDGADPQDLLRTAAELVDHLEPDRSLQAEALALAIRLNHPVYDCLYLALARREAATLVSCDQRLLSLAQQVLP